MRQASDCTSLAPMSTPAGDTQINAAAQAHRVSKPNWVSLVHSDACERQWHVLQLLAG